MPLVIQPDIHSVTREQLEAHLTEVRARRMLAAMALIETQNQKLAYLDDKLRRQIMGQNEMLEKEILRLDAMLEKVEARMEKIEMLKSDAAQVADQFELEDEEDES